MDQKQQMLATASHRAHGLGVSSLELLSQSGDVAATIIETAKSGHADVIVMGKRGLGSLSGLLLGSVSQKVVSLAPCPVIVVP